MAAGRVHRLAPGVCAAVVLMLVVPMAAAEGPPGFSGRTCWQKRAFYQARNRGLKETLGSGTAWTTPCVLDAYLAIERAAAEFGVTEYTDTMIRIAACESLLQPDIVGHADPADVGLFQWNEKPPYYWWSRIRRAFNAWQQRRADASHGRYTPGYATKDRYDPYNSARVASWVIAAYPHSWQMTWRCKGVYNPATRRLR